MTARDRRRGRSAWASAITATTDEQVFVRGIALDEAIGRESFPAMLLRLWRGDAATDAEAALMGACLVAAIDHGPLRRPRWSRGPSPRPGRRR